MSSTNLNNDEEASELEDLFEVSNRYTKKPLDETREEVKTSTPITHKKRRKRRTAEERALDLKA